MNNLHMNNLHMNKGEMFRATAHFHYRNNYLQQ